MKIIVLESAMEELIFQMVILHIDLEILNLFNIEMKDFT